LFVYNKLFARHSHEGGYDDIIFYTSNFFSASSAPLRLRLKFFIELIHKYNRSQT
jgi:hypothetical protein